MNKVKLFLIPFFSALLGAALMLGVVIWKPHWFMIEAKQSEPEQFGEIWKNQNKLFQNFDSLFDKKFFDHSDPFDEMKRMRERMQKYFDNRDTSNPFDSWFGDRFGGGSVEDISKREDENFVYYDIRIPLSDGTSVKTTVENGYLTITGEVTRDQGSTDTNSSFFSSTFKRTFPLPPNVDATKMQSSHEKDKFVVKFPKVKN